MIDPATVPAAASWPATQQGLNLPQYSLGVLAVAASQCDPQSDIPQVLGLRRRAAMQGIQPDQIGAAGSIDTVHCGQALLDDLSCYTGTIRGAGAGVRDFRFGKVTAVKRDRDLQLIRSLSSTGSRDPDPVFTVRKDTHA